MKHSDQIAGVCLIACPDLALTHGRINLYRYPSGESDPAPTSD